MTIDQILHRLRTTECTVSELAAEVGVLHETIINRVHKATGLKPLEYRYSQGWLAQNVPPWIADEIVAAHKSFSVERIATKFGMSRKTVSKVLRARGVALKPGVRSVITPELASEWAQRYARGESCHRIAVDHGVVEKTVRRGLNHAGVERRPLGRRGEARHPSRA